MSSAAGGVKRPRGGAAPRGAKRARSMSPASALQALLGKNRAGAEAGPRVEAGSWCSADSALEALLARNRVPASQERGEALEPSLWEDGDEELTLEEAEQAQGASLPVLAVPGPAPAPARGAEPGGLDLDSVVGQAVQTFAQQLKVVAEGLPVARPGQAPPAFETLAACVAPAGPREHARQLWAAGVRPSPANPGRTICSPPCPRGPEHCVSATWDLRGAPSRGTLLMGMMSARDLARHEATGYVPERVALCLVCQLHQLLTFVTAVQLSEVPLPLPCVIAPVVARVDSVGLVAEGDSYAPEHCFVPGASSSVGLATPFPLLLYPMLEWVEDGSGWRLDNSAYWGAGTGALASPKNRFFR